MELGSEASSSLDSTNHVRFRASAPQASWPFSERLTRWTRPITIEILRPHLKTLHRLEIDETLYPNYDQWWVWALEDVIKCDFSVCLFFFCFSMLFFGGGAEQTGAATLAWWRRWRCASKSCAITCASSRPSSTAPRTSSDCSSRRAPLTRRPSKRSVFFFYFNFSFQSLIFFCNPFRGFGGGPVVQDAGLPFWLWVEYVSQSRLMGNQSSFMRRWLGWMSFLSIEFSSIHGCFFGKQTQPRSDS